jgi:hypothetical protein
MYNLNRVEKNSCSEPKKTKFVAMIQMVIIGRRIQFILDVTNIFHQQLC